MEVVIEFIFLEACILTTAVMSPRYSDAAEEAHMEGS